jgi:uncharacterized protein
MTRWLFAFLFLFASWARAEFEVPPLTGPVMDEVGVLRPQDRRDLEEVIRDYNSQGKAQIQILVIDSLGDLPIEEASIKITDKWKLGKAKQDNGILFLIAPNERKLRIEVGQGLEGALPDVIAKRIIADTVVPLFKARNLSAGIVVGTYQIIKYIDQEYADQHLSQPEPEPAKSIPGWVIIVILLLLLFIGRFLPASSFRGGRGGGWGGGGFGGGGWSGGGGGGGWSGGGGGFSGGGASGSW